MDFTQCYNSSASILMEGALGERLKREYGLKTDGITAMAGLVYLPEGRRALKEIWEGYIYISKKYGLPFMATTPTRRANRERVFKDGYDESIIADNVRFLKNVRIETCAENMYVGGLMGCKGDAYTGKDSLGAAESEKFHKWQADLFKSAGAEFLFAGIMPSLTEAIGMARAMESVSLPYIISFTIEKNGRLADGTPIDTAIKEIDDATVQNPLCYFANCVHPSVVSQALEQSFNKTARVSERFKGIQANTSALSYSELDNPEDLKTSPPEELAAAMEKLYKNNGFKIFGGCCGTDERHIEMTAAFLAGAKKKGDHL